MNNNSDTIENDTVTLTLDDDKQVECAIIAIFHAGDQEYIALLPLDSNGEQVSEDVYLYRYIDYGDERDPELENIVEDDEYEIVADAFDELLDTWEYEEENSSTEE